LIFLPDVSIKCICLYMGTSVVPFFFTSNGRLICEQLIGNSMEVVAAKFELLAVHLHGGNEENREKH
jgi:hypothetical protein